MPDAPPESTDNRNATPNPDSSRRFVLACSPRRGGNTDLAAGLLRQALSENNAACDVWRAADAAVRPCVACGRCDKRPGTCTLDAPFLINGEQRQDAALPLLRSLCAAPAACLVSPIYFYHLPGQAKSLLDRAQSFWGVPGSEKPGRGKSLGVVLIAARPRGDKLFSGAVLTLRYVAEALGLALAEPLLLYGLDGPGDLDAQPDAQERIFAYGRALAAASSPARV